MTVIIRQLVPEDVLGVDLQPCQAIEPGDIDLAYGTRVAAHGRAWTAERDGKVIGCGGLLEMFPTQALAWALLSRPMGNAMVAVTRQARRAMAEAQWPRVEALVRADWPEALEWAAVMGMRQAAYLRRWGPMGVDHVLYEVIR